MKTPLLNIFIAILVLTPVAVLSQANTVSDQDLTGVWKGALYNDTTHRFLPYEIAISKEKGKLIGYSYTQFENTDREEWIIKKIKIRQKGEQLIIEDVEHILNTFNEPPPRGVRWMGIVDFHADDTSLQLEGKWSTSRTKEYSPATGSIRVKRTQNYRPLTIFKRLHELDLDETLSFVIADQNQNDVAANTNKPVEAQPRTLNPGTTDATVIEGKATTDPSKNVGGKTAEIAAAQKANTAPTSTVSNAGQNPVQNTKPAAAPGLTTIAANIPAGTSVTPGNESVKVADQKGLKPGNQNNPVKETPAAIVASSSPAQDQKIIVDATQQSPPKQVPAEKELVAASPVSPGDQKALVPANQASGAPVENVVSNQATEATAVSSPAPMSRIDDHRVGKEVTAKADPLKVNTAIKPITMNVAAAANVAKRTISNTQEVLYQSDSLVLSLYDNGEVDGDTVSVLLNGNIIFAKQGLTTRANSKVIYISPDTPDSLMLVMYAENLGSIPPNTGLLVVRDGEKIYDLRFRADLQSNAAIILRRKRR